MSRPKKAASGEANGHSKLSESNVLGILIMLGKGITKTKIARKYSVSPKTIWNIENQRNWSHVKLFGGKRGKRKKNRRKKDSTSGNRVTRMTT